MKPFKLIPVVMCALVIMLSCKKTQVNIDTPQYDFAYANYGDLLPTILAREQAHSLFPNVSMQSTTHFARPDNSTDGYAFSLKTNKFIWGRKTIIANDINSDYLHHRWFHILDSLYGVPTKLCDENFFLCHMVWTNKRDHVIVDSTGGSINIDYFPLKYSVND